MNEILYINENSGQVYAGDMQTGDRTATAEEIAAFTKDKRTYAQKRQEEYPSIGDMIDALCKAKAGNDSELTALMTVRDSIKVKYPKE